MRYRETVYAIESCYPSYGWEEVTQETTYRAGRDCLKNYRQNEPKTPHRMVTRRIFHPTVCQHPDCCGEVKNMDKNNPKHFECSCGAENFIRG